jgi:hypothetical protein
MIEKTLAMIIILGLGFFCSLTDGNHTKSRDFEADLTQTKREKDVIEARMHELTQE